MAQCGRPQMAETEGFEPSMELLTPYSLSRGAPSAARASLHKSAEPPLHSYRCQHSPHDGVECRGQYPREGGHVARAGGGRGALPQTPRRLFWGRHFDGWCRRLIQVLLWNGNDATNTHAAQVHNRRAKPAPRAGDWRCKMAASISEASNKCPAARAA